MKFFLSILLAFLFYAASGQGSAGFIIKPVSVGKLVDFGSHLFFSVTSDTIVGIQPEGEPCTPYRSKLRYTETQGVKTWCFEAESKTFFYVENPDSPLVRVTIVDKDLGETKTYFGRR